MMAAEGTHQLAILEKAREAIRQVLEGKVLLTRPVIAHGAQQAFDAVKPMLAVEQGRSVARGPTTLTPLTAVTPFAPHGLSVGLNSEPLLRASALRAWCLRPYGAHWRIA